MGAEHPTGTETKVEKDDPPKPSDRPPTLRPDNPGSPGQPSRLESRAAAQRPPEAETDDRRETPPATRSPQAEQSNDPNRVGTPRADSIRAAIARQTRLRGENSTERAEAPATAPGSHAERDNDTGTSETPRADSRTVARDDVPSSEDEETGAPEGEQRDAAGTQPGGTGPAEDEDREQNTDEPTAAAGEKPPGGQDGTVPREDRPPDMDGAEDVERPAETATSEVADAQPPAEAGEHIGDERTGPEAGREAEPETETPDVEPPIRPERETTEAPDPLADGQEHTAPEPVEAQGTPGDERPDRTTDEPGDDGNDRGREAQEAAEDPAEPPSPEETRDPFAHLPTRADLDPVGAGVWTADRGELAPVNENQDLREPAPERDSPSKRAMRGMSNDVEDALKTANKINDDLQGPLDGPRSPSDFPTGTKDIAPTMKAVDNPTQIPSSLVGVISAAMLLYSAGRGAQALITGFLRRNDDRDR
ncbi:hypothetical protein [Spirillospora sp. NPDC048823]|uniref:hypothetical protein n=1 Tax=unclassified Spirillospora TaxID=2642701 RepID=UPI003716AD95